MLLLKIPGSPFWYLDFRDHRNVTHRISTKITDKRAARSYADKIVTLVEYRRAGLDLNPDLAAWVSRMPAKRRDQLLQLEIVDSKNTAFGTFEEHKDAFQKHMESQDLNPVHIQGTISQIEAVWEGAGAKTVEGIRPAAVSTWLKQKRDDGMSVSTSNHYVVAVKSFTAWCTRTGRIHRNPLLDLRKLKAMPVRRPRAMTRAEMSKLYAVTRGTHRYWVYRLAIETALRRRQLKSLTRDSFDLKSGTVTVLESASKSKRKAVLPLRVETTRELRKWLNTRPRKGPVLPIQYRSSLMLERDLKTAKIAKKNAHGVLTFHSLRHTAITELARAGVHPKIAQQFAQHASITTTMDVYSHVSDSELRKAVESIAKVS